ncbi:hypothetical protein ABH908_000240 [Pseudomonas frederiksbergensis]|uniref:hypothetical protein n=1 Tax=Pseudomonas TaxID=286 RepID=UPI003D1F9285
MESATLKDQAAIRLLRTIALRTWGVARIFLIYVVGLFALSGLADLVLIWKDLPPVKAIFFPHETHACLAVAIVWVAWKIRSHLLVRALRVTTITTHPQSKSTHG